MIATGMPGNLRIVTQGSGLAFEAVKVFICGALRDARSRRSGRRMRRLRASEQGKRLKLLDAFAAGFDWALKGTGQHGDYNGGPVEDGFDYWLREAASPDKEK